LLLKLLQLVAGAMLLVVGAPSCWPADKDKMKALGTLKDDVVPSIALSRWKVIFQADMEMTEDMCGC
jgi:hypothetical protein